MRSRLGVGAVALLTAGLLQGMSAAPGRAEPVTTTATVLKVVDGDTIDIHDDVRGRLRIRVPR